MSVAAVGSLSIQVTNKTQLQNPPALLFIHSANSTKEMWNAVLPHFEQTHQMITYDLRAHGESYLEGRAALIEADFSMDQMVADLEQVAATAQLGKFTIVANGMGASIGVYFAQKHPDKVLGLILSEFSAEKKESFSSEKLAQLRAFKENHDLLAQAYSEFVQHGANMSFASFCAWSQEGRVVSMPDGTWSVRSHPYIAHIAPNGIHRTEAAKKAFQTLPHSVPVLLVEADEEALPEDFARAILQFTKA